WNVQASRAERSAKTRSDKAVIRWNTPCLVDQFDRLNSAPRHPFAFYPCHDEKWILKQNFDVQVFICARVGDSSKHQIDSALAQLAVLQSEGSRLRHIEAQSRILPREPVDHSRH